MDNNQPYTILPFNFKLFDEQLILLTNNAGEFHFLNLPDFDLLLSYSLPQETNLHQDLKSKQFIANTDIILALELLATKYRSKKSYLRNFTTLHMMVITLRCNHNCEYCQVSSESADAFKYDMTEDTAKKVVKTIFNTPSPYIKIEFQGGEPLLNWKTIVATVESAKELNKTKKKDVDFVICTNLTLIDEEMCKFIKEHNILLSTSLDGDKEIHDKCRKSRLGGSSYDLFIEKLELTKKYLAQDKIASLLTISAVNIDRLKEVIDEYVRLGFEGVFFRALNPYGLASQKLDILNYPMEEFINAFEEGLDYIIELNLNNKRFIEHYTTLLMTRILTPFGTGFVDLQSPSGTGISGVIYDYNGDVYPADEARMLARMGDKHFLLGNVYKDSYLKIFQGSLIKEIVYKSIIECMPSCFSCLYQPYCGADPIRNYLETKDIIGHRPTSDFCKKHMGIFNILFKKILKNDSNEMDVIWSWITKRHL